MIRIDTNYIIRYLVNDNIKMADIAQEVLTTEEVFISHEVMAEVIYVLDGVYEITKEDIIMQVKTLLLQDNIHSLNDTLTLKALNIFVEKNIDFVDALLCAYSINDEIRTFDKKLLKCMANNHG